MRNFELIYYGIDSIRLYKLHNYCINLLLRWKLYSSTCYMKANAAEKHVRRELHYVNTFKNTFWPQQLITMIEGVAKNRI